MSTFKPGDRVEWAESISINRPAVTAVGTIIELDSNWATIRADHSQYNVFRRVADLRPSRKPATGNLYRVR